MYYASIYSHFLNEKSIKWSKKMEKWEIMLYLCFVCLLLVISELLNMEGVLTHYKFRMFY